MHLLKSFPGTKKGPGIFLILDVPKLLADGIIIAPHPVKDTRLHILSYSFVIYAAISQHIHSNPMQISSQYQIGRFIVSHRSQISLK